ncbi:MAG TPA: hypothetical protein VMB22_01415, partial [Verrucomicrobiae bacterium]|nr:hypothetical protein [Verrucomicrobiae bacterium]
ATVSRLLVAGDGANDGYDSREVGSLYLGRINTLTTEGGWPQIDIGENSAQGAGANNDPNPQLTSYLYLGQANGIYCDSIGVGRSKSAGVLAFNPYYTNGLNPSLFLRGVTNSRVSVLSVGDASALGSSNQRTEGTVNWSGGNVNAMIDTAYIGRSMNGNDTGTAISAQGVLTFDNGTVDVNTLEAGYQTLATGTGPGSSGTVNVNGEGLLNVNQTLELAHGDASSPLEQGTLNVNGGTVTATNIVGGGGISTINLNSGTVDLQGMGQIANISTLNIGANSVGNPALLQDAVNISASNAIVIAANGEITGNTVISSLGLTVNGTVAPGDNEAGGMTNNGPVTFSADGSYMASVDDAMAGPATGWSYLQVNGSLNVQSSSGSPFAIGVQAPNGSAANFNYNTNYDWPIATATGGIANFNANDFAVDDSQFDNDLAGGYFYVRQSGNALVLSFTNNHPPVAGITWLYRTGNPMTIPLSSLTNTWSDPDGDPVQLLSVNGSTNGASLGNDTNNIYYTNAHEVADEISYTVEDIRTNPPAIYQAGDTQQTGTGEIILLPPPAIGGVQAGGNSLVMSGGGGKPLGAYYVLGTTNLALPVAQWTMLSTNAFDANGNFNLTNPTDPSQPQWFYLLQAQ